MKCEERLTKKLNDNENCENCHIYKCINKLGELEEKLENGTLIERPYIKFRLKYQNCDRDGSYYGNSSWNDVVVFANTLSEAIEKAKRISETTYYRSLTYTAEEQIESRQK